MARDPHEERSEAAQLELIPGTATAAARAADSEIRGWSRLGFDASGVAMALLTADGTTIVRGNRALADLLGVDRSQLPGRLVSDHLHADDVAQSVAALRDAHGGSPQVRTEVRLIRTDGTEVHCLTSAVLLRDRSGRPEAFFTQVIDVSDLHAAEAKARFHERLLGAVGQAVIASDRGGRITYCNPAAVALFGWDGGPPTGAQIHHVLAADAQRHVTGVRAKIAAGAAFSGECLLQRADGSTFPGFGTVSPFYNPDGTFAGYLAIASDISELKRAEALLAGQARVLELVAMTVPLREVVRQLAELIEANLPGVRCRFAIGSEVDASPEPVVDDDDTPVWSFTLRSSRRHQTVGRLVVEVEPPRRLTQQELDLLLGLVRVAEVAIDRQDVQAELEYRATFDSLTGLPNRTSFHDATSELLKVLARGDKRHLAVLFVDIDSFKLVNDCFGHRVGDEVLRSTAARFLVALPEGAVLARLGGDQFGVCLLVEDEDAATAVAARLNGALSRPWAEASSGREVFLTASVGITTTVDPGAEVESLLQEADAALYHARESGPGSHARYHSDLYSQALERLEIETTLRRAVQQHELEVHFQPVVRVADQRISGVEALIRWRLPDGSLRSPDEFIGVAERSGLILPVGDVVLAEACRMASHLAVRWPEHQLTVAVNLSARQLSDPHLVERLGAAITAASIDPARLCLEITESVVMEDAARIVTTLRSLKALGVRLSIDDFGTGYSSLSYLRRFPVDELKVDRSFVRDLGIEPESEAIVAAVVGLGHTLGMHVVAEGVEGDEQLRALQALGCDMAQGFRWSRAVAFEEVDEVLGALDLSAKTAATAAAAAAKADAAAAASGSRTTAGERADQRRRSSAHAATAGDPSARRAGAARADEEGLPASVIAAVAAGGAEPPAQASGGVSSVTADEAVAQAIGVLAHELRTPLTILKGYAGILLNAAGSADPSLVAEGLEAITRNVEAVDQLIAAVWDSQAIENGTLQVALERIDLAELVRDVADDLSLAVTDRPLEVDGVESAIVSADPRRMRQVITNLVTNAAKYAPAGTPIEITVEREGSEVAIHVVDHGPGIPPERARDVFRRFSRIDRSKAGTGVGLFVSRGIARAHGGDVRVRRAPTGGADFVVTLPLADVATGPDVSVRDVPELPADRPVAAC